MDAHVNIYDGTTLIAVLSGPPRDTWSAARASVRSLARDAGTGRIESLHQEWIRTPGRWAYCRAGFRAVNTFRQEGVR